ncbi:M15 family metallopeptidase [Psychrobacillus sp. Sa2BUA9]|uniref:M15 family metallopeptidase n=1 Tax=Psychrobacillus faecigallinarum TaxID=2762235 RepID=A0ABR8RFM9_9BACI|nr:M15 family metallopeptidase [Psychrobacillus faecigallinarum]MBD7946357.1 M15 family metallopeptidase [Psychrobacillus faecigallinarum]
MVVALEELIRRSVNRIGAVHPSLKEYTIELIKRCYNEGIYIQISSGFRSNEDQAYIYGQGRPNYIWNGKKYGSKGSIVSNAQPGTSIHNYGLAIDYFLVSNDGSKSLWVVNEKWRRVAAIAKSMGFEWGGDWKSFKDYPHLQYNKGLSIAQLKAGHRPVFPPLKAVDGITNTDKIMWGKTELKKGQIGKVTILKRINLWQDGLNGKLQMVRVLNPGEEYRVYRDRVDHGGQYNVGVGMWITKMDGFIKYETPSKAMLAKLNSK